LQFFPNQAQFANDLLGDLVFQEFTSLSRNTIAFTAGSSIVLPHLVVRVSHREYWEERSESGGLV